MDNDLFHVLLFYGYPVLVYLFLSSSLKRHMRSLDQQVEQLRDALRRMAPADRQARQTEAPVAAAPAEAAVPPAAPAPAMTAAPESAPAPAPLRAADIGPPPEIAIAQVQEPAAPEPAAMAPATQAGPASEPAPPAAQTARPADVAQHATSADTRPPLPRPAPPVPAAAAATAAAPVAPADIRSRLITACIKRLFSGKMVAKGGLLILFIGVSFLLKYVAERVTVPIEVRLSAVVLADIGLLVWGWRIRLTRRELGPAAQGTALAILMLVSFGAMRLYHLIPPAMAFALLFILTVFTAVLAVLQNTIWLAVFAIVGGFLSPILTATGQGSHIALFSYYALLNAGILAIALKRDWRPLNLLGMAFTFTIGTAWGVLKYSPEQHYRSTQAFLLLFFLFYVALGLIHALRHRQDQQRYVDATLVFGTPLLSFGLQLALTRHMPFGHAYSATGFGLFYMTLAMALWRRRGAGRQLLVESYLAMGVMFGTLALPLAFDGRWTSAVWALEGCALVWVGLRQRQPLTWAFGLLVQAGAALSFMRVIGALDWRAAAHANLWLGCLLLAASSFFMAIRFRERGDDQGRHDFDFLTNSLLAVGALWLLAASWIDIILRCSGAAEANLLAASGLATAAALAWLAARMRWQMASQCGLAIELLAGAAVLALAAAWPWTTPSDSLPDSPLVGVLLIAAGAAFTAWWMRRAAANPAPTISSVMLAWSLCWWFGPILNLLSGRLMLALDGSASGSANETWWALYGIGLAASALCCCALAARLAWPQLRLASALIWLALPAMTVPILFTLYTRDIIPAGLTWIAYLMLWGVNEYLMRPRPAHGWRIDGPSLKLLHLIRCAALWSMIWPVGAIWTGRWLLGTAQEQRLLAEGYWQVSGSWAHFLPAWAMMLAAAWLLQRSRDGRWPTTPIPDWYRQILIPAATGWSLLLVLRWNLEQDGGMAPLPYLPLLNPLDLSTGFALLLAALCYRALRADGARLTPAVNQLVARLPRSGALAAYLWFNLMLLRSAAHLLDLPYRFAPLFASQAVQAMLSLAWSVTAMVLMRVAASKALRQQWMVGAALLGLVVVKLFLVDLSSIGSMARIVSFLGVGLLMVMIGYLAPFPGQHTPAPGPAAD